MGCHKPLHTSKGGKKRRNKKRLTYFILLKGANKGGRRGEVCRVRLYSPSGCIKEKEKSHRFAVLTFLIYERTEWGQRRASFYLSLSYEGSSGQKGKRAEDYFHLSSKRKESREEIKQNPEGKKGRRKRGCLFYYFLDLTSGGKRGKKMVTRDRRRFSNIPRVNKGKGG